MKEFKTTLEDYVSAQKLHQSTRAFVSLLGVFAFTILIIFLLFNDFKVENLFIKILVFIAATLSFLTLTYFARENWFKRIYLSQKSVNDTNHISFNEEGVEYKSVLGNTKLPWNHILKYKINENIITMYGSLNLMHLVPLRAFETQSEKDKFLDFLNKHSKSADEYMEIEQIPVPNKRPFGMILIALMAATGVITSVSNVFFSTTLPDALIFRHFNIEWVWYSIYVISIFLGIAIIYAIFARKRGGDKVVYSYSGFYLLTTFFLIQIRSIDPDFTNKVYIPQNISNNVNVNSIDMVGILIPGAIFTMVLCLLVAFYVYKKRAYFSEK